MYNENLSVVNYPDSLGAACDFQPFSFYLGGKRTYWGLPNNPDYNLGAIIGSPCDTLSVGISETETTSKASLHVFYNAAAEKLFINAQNFKGKYCTLQIFDVMGRKVFLPEKNTAALFYSRYKLCSSCKRHVYYQLANGKRKFI